VKRTSMIEASSSAELAREPMGLLAIGTTAAAPLPPPPMPPSPLPTSALVEGRVLLAEVPAEPTAAVSSADGPPSALPSAPGPSRTATNWPGTCAGTPP